MREHFPKVGIYLFFVFVLAGAKGCEPEVSTRTYSLIYPSGGGHFDVVESFYYDSGYVVRHGISSYTDRQSGAAIGKCEWLKGQPREGICWVPALGDAGSAAGLGSFKKYENGKLLKTFKDRPQMEGVA